MPDATILEWFVEDGDYVRAGQRVAAIETAKADVEVEAIADGFLSIVAHEGMTLVTDEVLGIIRRPDPVEPT